MTIHCLGNGRVCIYGRGAEVIQAFGPSYSSPTAFSVRTDLRDTETRKISHIAFSHVSPDAELLDYLPDEADLFVRIVRGRASFVVTGESAVFEETPYPGTYLASTRPGAYMMGGNDREPDGVSYGYPSARFRHTALAVSGDAVSRRTEDGQIRIETDGEAVLRFGFDGDPVRLFETMARAAASPLTPADSPSLRPPREIAVSPEHPYFGAVCDGYDVIAAQQSEAGSVLAGYNYHMCYVRDSYGVLRFLLAAGALDRARRLVRYFIGVFDSFGAVHNAQGMTEYGFHIHENDDVEITGYLVLMLTEYARVSGDRETAEAGFPLAAHCLGRQHENLCGGVLPFNGDETYVAGGFLPRSALNDGSAEATSLYRRAISEAVSLFGAGKLGELYGLLLRDAAEIDEVFGMRFFGPGGTFYCNCPGTGRIPEIRAGGVRACGHWLGISFRNKNGDYVCPRCLNRELPPAFPGLYGKRFETESAVLGPAFAGTELLSRETTERIAGRILRTLPGRRSFVGYEYGMAVYALGRCGGETAGRMLSLRDEFGAWSEYYEDGAQAGTLCRPWETAVNLTALLTAKG